MIPGALTLALLRRFVVARTTLFLPNWFAGQVRGFAVRACAALAAAAAANALATLGRRGTRFSTPLPFLCSCNAVTLFESAVTRIASSLPPGFSSQVHCAALALADAAAATTAAAAAAAAAAGRCRDSILASDMQGQHGQVIQRC